jgi:hypothetical protein
MLTKPRWEAEVRLMQNVLPSFEAVAEPGRWAGFQGWFQGPRTGRMYRVTIRGSVERYPNEEPAVYIHPRPEPHHWIHDGRLCYQREGHSWKPAEDTFAQALMIAVKYVNEFDGRG